MNLSCPAATIYNSGMMIRHPLRIGIWRLLPVLVLLFGLTGVSSALTSRVPQPGSIWLLDLKGTLGPANADYLVRGLADASASGARAVIIRIDTPGGLDLSMRDLIRAILASPIPVIGYVSPSGARAASAGTYILYACHIAAMSPATNLGAATPVQLAVSSADATQETDQQDKAARPAPQAGTGSAMERKLVNDAIAYIRGLAELRGRNADWAEKAVREGASLSAGAALEQGVIDLIASDLDDLLAKLDGRQVTIDDKAYTLSLGDARLVEQGPDWRSDFLAVITNPNVAYILMLLGIYGLIFEFSNPGIGLPGIVGGVSILLALYAFQVLPISYTGLGLIILGLALMVAEAFAPSFGALGLGGLVAFVFGSIILMDTELPAFRIALPVVLAIGVSSAGLLAMLLGMVWRARRQKLVSGSAVVVGKTGIVEQLHDGQAMIRVDGELWQTDCSEPLTVGDTVRVAAIRGLRLQVDKLGRSR